MHPTLSHTFHFELTGSSDVTVTRQFAAPPERVFDAYTQCQHLQQWLRGPEGWSMPECYTDLRPGGTYRHLMRHTSGQQMGWGGTYRAVERPTRIVTLELFDEPWYPGEAEHTLTLAHTAGVTTLTLLIHLESPEGRNIYMQVPWHEGMRAAYDSLEALLHQLA